MKEGYGNKIATGLAQEPFSLRGKMVPSYYQRNDAISCIKDATGLVAVVDYADNAAGGALSDSTYKSFGRLSVPRIAINASVKRPCSLLT